jgi:rSAM/selenodomain-associated transferase 2/rSAM/selenodomain-associated transferase 1
MGTQPKGPLLPSKTARIFISKPPSMPAASIEQLIVFTRYPRPGLTKTRLIPLLGARGAAELQRRMTERLVGQARRVRLARRVFLCIRHEGGSGQQIREWLGDDLACRPQGHGDLGRRMARAFGGAFAEGAEAAVIVGSDIPHLTAPVLLRAFELLQEHNLVLGPADDGGYYLIGLRRAVFQGTADPLFSEPRWGGGSVFDTTVAIAVRRGLRPALTPELSDVDRPRDLAVWRRIEREIIEGSISVVIPTLNEADCIAATLGSIPREDVVEVIVVDGGSSDDTVRRASALTCRVIPATPPRSRQMNIGAAHAAGEILLFLHADTRLPKGFAKEVRRICALPGVAAGAFTLRIDSRRPGIGAVERMTNLRSRRLGLPYGDQALFLKTETFSALNGFKPLPIMEDFDLVRRLGRVGQVTICDRPVLTSGRRWERWGVIRATLIHQVVIAAYHIGLPPVGIARWYHRRR